MKKGMCCGAEDCNASYLLGAIGAAVYYVSTSAGFWAGFVGLLKALVWPAFLVFDLMKFIGD